MMVNAYPSMLVSAMSAIRISEAQMQAAAGRVYSGNLDMLPEAMSSMTVAKLAHQVAIRVMQEEQETMHTALDLIA